MGELERLREKAPIIEKLAERGYFSKSEMEVLRILNLLEEEESNAQQG